MNALTIPEMLKNRVKATPDSPAHFTTDKDGKWQKTKWKEYYEAVMSLAVGLQNIGLKPGHNIGIMAPTSQAWEYIQMAVLFSGGVVVGIDPKEIKENIDNIVKKTNCLGIFVQNMDRLKKIDLDLSSQFEFIVSIEDSNQSKNCYQLREIDTTEKNDTITVDSDDLATIIFTSGTTGEPKGISYTHAQVTLACQSILKGFPDINSNSNLPCWLPLSNLFQRIINLCGIDIGASTYFIENPREIIDLLPQIQPHLFIGVPRVFEKLYAAIEMQIMMKPVWQRWFIHIALNAGDKYARSKRSKTKLSLFNLMLYLAMDRFVLNKIRSVLGTHIKYLISGSAPMPKWLLERYHALGLLVLEAYGISENIIPNAMNIPEDFKFGTVGKPISENMIALLEDDELLVKGPGVFSGYYNDNNQKELFTSDGYFPTGDYASFDKDGYLSITGRKSEVFKTSTGRKISPVSIESRLQQIFYVEHAVLFGQGKKFLTALVTISPSILAKQLGTKEDSDLDYKNLLSKEALGIIAYDLFFQIEPFPNFKRPAGIYITDHQLSVEMKELTSNLKLKRKNIEENFKYHLAQMNNYIEKGDVPDTLSTFKKVDGMVLFF